MASLFRDRSLGLSKRESSTGTASSRFTTIATATTIAATSPLPSPFGDLTRTLSTSDLRDTAYEIFVSACRTFTGKPLTYIPAPSSSSLSGSPSLSSSPSMQRSITSTAASKMKKVLGLRSSSSSGLGLGSKRNDSNSRSGGGGKGKKPVTVGELMRVSESTDSRGRRALLRIAAG